MVHCNETKNVNYPYQPRLVWFLIVREERSVSLSTIIHETSREMKMKQPQPNLHCLGHPRSHFLCKFMKKKTRCKQLKYDLKRKVVIESSPQHLLICSSALALLESHSNNLSHTNGLGRLSSSKYFTISHSPKIDYESSPLISS